MINGKTKIFKNLQTSIFLVLQNNTFIIFYFILPKIIDTRVGR